jgi:hypothetical protein
MRWRKEEINNFQSHGTTGIKDMLWREKYITMKSQRTIGKLYKTVTRRQIKDKLNTDG